MKTKLIKKSVLSLGTLALSLGGFINIGQVSAEEPLTLTFFSADLTTDDPFTNPVA